MARQTKEARLAKRRANNALKRAEIAATKRAYQVAHRDELAAKKKEYQAAHRDEIAARKKAQRAANRAKEAAREREYRAANREKITAREQAYRKANIDKVRLKWHNRHARLRGNGGRHTVAEWRALCAWFGDVCLRCGAADKLSRDHVVPTTKGGTNNIDNLQPLCLPCNQRKHSNTTDYRDPALLAAFIESLKGNEDAI